MVTYRQVAMAMGAWKWGYPKGERIGISAYQAVKDKRGRMVWRSAGKVCDGLTAHNIDYYKELYPVAFEYCMGSIHNQEVS